MALFSVVLHAMAITLVLCAARTWATGLAVAALVLCAHPAALTFVHALLHLLHLLVKGGLLRCAQGRIKSFDSVAAPVGFGSALDAQSAHAVDAFGRGQVVHAFTVQAGMALAGLHG